MLWKEPEPRRWCVHENQLRSVQQLLELQLAPSELDLLRDITTNTFNCRLHPLIRPHRQPGEAPVRACTSPSQLGTVIKIIYCCLDRGERKSVGSYAGASARAILLALISLFSTSPNGLLTWTNQIAPPALALLPPPPASAPLPLSPPSPRQRGP